MNYIESNDASATVTQIVDTIKGILANNKKVLWLMSGGSGGKVSVSIAKELSGTDISNLYVTLSDERFGAVGHADENWQLLLNDGLSLPGASLYRPLIGLDRDQTTKQFGQWLTQTLDAVDYVIGLFGIGPDGHTAGIKPNSEAVNATEFVASFTGEDFERITITPKFITRIDEAVIQAFGEDKFPVIDQLLTQSVSIEQQPAQILKDVPKVTLYSNYSVK